MIQIIGEMNKTRDGRSFFIDYAEFIPEAGPYDLVLFGLRRDDQDFSMTVAFLEESMSAWGARDFLVREGLAHVRAQLDHGVEEDGSLIEVPSAASGTTYRISMPCSASGAGYRGNSRTPAPLVSTAGTVSRGAAAPAEAAALYQAPTAGDGDGHGDLRSTGL